MIVGFTGSRKSPTPQQQVWLREQLENSLIDEFHHGDCIGSDQAAHDIALSLSLSIHIHPPTLAKYRAFLTGDKIYPELPFLARDREMVNTIDMLYATPDGPERVRSGTWYTIRYARKVGKPVHLVMPRGSAVLLV